MQTKHLSAAGPGQLSRRERQKAATRDRLYRTALRLFAERGLAGTTVEDITRAAGVAKGTFFIYFRTKEQVFGVLMENQLANVAAMARAALEGRESTRAVLRQLFHRNAGEFGRSATLTRALLSSVFLHETAREITARGMAEGRRGLVKIIALGQQRGEVRTDRKPAAIALAFQQALFGTFAVWAVHGEGKLAARLDESFENFWAGAAAGAGK